MMKEPLDVEELSKKLGDETREIFDKACLEANKILNLYGLKVRYQTIVETNSASEKDVKEG